MTTDIETVELAPGYEISRLIHGGWQDQDTDAETALKSLHAHAEAGITAFETSDTYRGGEALLGRFVKQRARTTDVPPRIHTRLSVGREAAAPSKSDVEVAVARSLTRLGIERIDLLQLQWWRPPDSALIDIAGWLSDLKNGEKVAHLGVTNFSTAMLAALSDAGIPIIANQVQNSLIDRRAGGDMVRHCAAHGIALLGYGPLAGGFLTPKWRGRADPYADNDHPTFSREYRLMVDLFGGWALLQELLSALDRVAARHGVGIPAVAARWAMDQIEFKAILLGAANARNLTENLALFEFALDDDDKEAIDAVLARGKSPSGDVGELERDANGPFTGIIQSTRSPD